MASLCEGERRGKGKGGGERGKCAEPNWETMLSLWSSLDHWQSTRFSCATLINAPSHPQTQHLTCAPPPPTVPPSLTSVARCCVPSPKCSCCPYSPMPGLLCAAPRHQLLGGGGGWRKAHTATVPKMGPASSFPYPGSAVVVVLLSSLHSCVHAIARYDQS